MPILDEVYEAHVSIEDEYDNIKNYEDYESKNLRVQTNDVYTAGNAGCPINEHISDEKLHQNRPSVIRTIFWVLATSHGIWQVTSILLDILFQYFAF